MGRVGGREMEGENVKERREKKNVYPMVAWKSYVKLLACKSWVRGHLAVFRPFIG